MLYYAYTIWFLLNLGQGAFFWNVDASYVLHIKCDISLKYMMLIVLANGSVQLS